VIAWLLGLWAMVTLSWWGFAFAQPGPASAWLKTAQAACFGSLADGLPSAWGWAVLLLAPLSLLTGLLAAYQEELALLRRRRVLPWLALFGAAFLAQGAWVGLKIHRALRARAMFSINAPAEALPESYPRSAGALPSFKLTDQRGRQLDNAGLRGRPHVLTFAYAHCATICPFLVRDTLTAVRAVPGAQTLFLTLDPWRDTPSSLPGLAARWGMGDESRLLSGPPAAVLALLKGLDVPYRRDEKTGVVDHPPLVFVLDAQGRVAYRFNRPNPEWIQEAVRRLAREG
jgi:cytochrome oxidase Cu insertion factor (SCO1/SenC/PrrC family)